MCPVPYLRSWEVLDTALREIVETGGDMAEYRQVLSTASAGMLTP